MEDKIQNSKLVTLDNVGYPVQALWFIGSETLFGFQIFWIWAYLNTDEGYFLKYVVHYKVPVHVYVSVVE